MFMNKPRSTPSSNKTGIKHSLIIIIIVVVSSIVLVLGILSWQKRGSIREIENSTQEKNTSLQNNDDDLNSKREEVQTGALAEMNQEKINELATLVGIPLSLPTSGELVKSREVFIDGTSSTEIYLDHINDAGIVLAHAFFTGSNNTPPQLILFYQLTSQSLEWKFGKNDQQTLATKPTAPWLNFVEFAGKDIVDLTLNGEELHILDTPIHYEDGRLGSFQDDVDFQLQSFSEGTLQVKDKKFLINFEQNTVKEEVIEPYQELTIDTPEGSVKVSLQELGIKNRYTPLTIQWLNKDDVVTNALTVNDTKSDIWELDLQSLEQSAGGAFLTLSGQHAHSLEKIDFQIKINKDGIVSDTIETFSYLVSNDPYSGLNFVSSFCDGTNMDSAGYKSMLTNEISKTRILPKSLTTEEKIKKTLHFALNNNTDTLIDNLIFENGIVTMPVEDGWAGVSIFYCRWKPFVEKNLEQFSEVKEIKWVTKM